MKQPKKKYALNRFGGDAVGHILPRQKKKKFNFFISVEKVLENLTAIYEDPEEKNNMIFFYNLQINSNQKFIDLYSEYIRLITGTGYSEFHFIQYLKRKLVTKLAVALFYCFQITKFSEIKTIFIRVDNVHRLTGKNQIIKKMESIKSKFPFRRMTFV